MVSDGATYSLSKEKLSASFVSANEYTLVANMHDSTKTASVIHTAGALVFNVLLINCSFSSLLNYVLFLTSPVAKIPPESNTSLKQSPHR